MPTSSGVSSRPHAVVLPKKPGPYHVATAPRRTASGSSGETEATDAERRTTARRRNWPVWRARQRAMKVPSRATVVRARFVHACVTGSSSCTRTVRRASRRETVPRKRTLPPRRAVPPPEIANGGGGAVADSPLRIRHAIRFGSPARRVWPRRFGARERTQGLRLGEPVDRALERAAAELEADLRELARGLDRGGDE